jgi:hypothetical protein
MSSRLAYHVKICKTNTAGSHDTTAIRLAEIKQPSERGQYVETRLWLQFCRILVAFRDAGAFTASHLSYIERKQYVHHVVDTELAPLTNVIWHWLSDSDFDSADSSIITINHTPNPLHISPTLHNPYGSLVLPKYRQRFVDGRTLTGSNLIIYFYYTTLNN